MTVTMTPAELRALVTRQAIKLSTLRADRNWWRTSAFIGWVGFGVFAVLFILASR